MWRSMCIRTNATWLRNERCIRVAARERSTKEPGRRRSTHSLERAARVNVVAACTRSSSVPVSVSASTLSRASVPSGSSSQVADCTPLRCSMSRCSFLTCCGVSSLMRTSCSPLYPSGTSRAASSLIAVAQSWRACAASAEWKTRRGRASDGDARTASSSARHATIRSRISSALGVRRRRRTTAPAAALEAARPRIRSSAADPHAPGIR
eukprot:scaffold17189_cov28-Tisochrysis_lutea.AAC.4